MTGYQVPQHQSKLSRVSLCRMDVYWAIIFSAGKMFRMKKFGYLSEWKSLVTCPKRQYCNIDSKVSFSLTGLLDHQPLSVSCLLKKPLLVFLFMMMTMMITMILTTMIMMVVLCLTTTHCQSVSATWMANWRSSVTTNDHHINADCENLAEWHLYNWIASTSTPRLLLSSFATCKEKSWQFKCESEKVSSTTRKNWLTLLAGMLRSSSSSILSILMFVFSSFGTKVTVTFISLQIRSFQGLKSSGIRWMLDRASW